MVVAVLGHAQVFGDIDHIYQRNYTYSLRASENNSQIYLMRCVDFEKVIRSHRDSWHGAERSCVERNQALLNSLANLYLAR